MNPGTKTLCNSRPGTHTSRVMGSGSLHPISEAVDEGPAGRLPIVALVCSAGGLEALTAILRQLPAEFPAPIIALQHRQPGEPDRLPSILRRRCLLPVVSAEDGAVLRAGTVFVVPPGQHAVVDTSDHIVLIPSDGPPPYRPSADLLLVSLALTSGPRTIAVVLSGMGRDGATGAEAVHRFGGLVIASDERSSAYFAMPKAAIERDQAVDLVLPINEIATKLVGLLKQRAVGIARAG